MIKRIFDWERRLDEFILTRRYAAFSWGKHDCCTFAADAIFEMSGTDVMGELRHTYRSLKEALGVVRSQGSLQAAVTRALGMPPGIAQRAPKGAIVLTWDSHNLPAVGVSIGRKYAIPGMMELSIKPFTLGSLIWDW